MMSRNNDPLPIQLRKRCSLQDPSSSQCAGPSTWTRYSSSSTSLLHSASSQSNFGSLLDPLDEITLDSDLDQRSASSATLPSPHVSPSQSADCLLADANYASSEPELSARPSESRQSLYPLREPGQMTAQRTERLRARIAAVIRSLPATEEDDADEQELRKATERPNQLRRVRGIRDLRRAFRDGDREPSHFTSTPSLEVSKASYELGILASPTAPLSHLSLHSSLRTLVDSVNARPQSSGDLKTLCQSTFSSISISSRFATKVYPSLSASRLSHTRLPSDTSLSIFPSKYLAHNPLTPRRTSLQLDTLPSHEPKMAIWSCAKISQSATKRAARRGHTPRRVFSNPIAAPSP